jgi:hypothetical protein
MGWRSLSRGPSDWWAATLQEAKDLVAETDARAPIREQEQLAEKTDRRDSTRRRVRPIPDVARTARRRVPVWLGGSPYLREAAPAQGGVVA